MLNNELTITGGATAGPLLVITSQDADDDTVTLTGAGTGDVLQITANATTAIGLNVIAKANQTVSLVKFDGATGNWIGNADDVPMVLISADTANAHTGTALFSVTQSAAALAASEGFLARFVASGVATTDATAVEIEVAATQPALAVNGITKINGQDNAGAAIFQVAGNGTTGNMDAMTITNIGTGDGLQITSTATGKALNAVGGVAQTSSLVVVDGATGADWRGAANLGMVHILSDGTAAATTATLLRVALSGTNVSGQAAMCLDLVDTSTSGGGTEYVMQISSTNNEALNIPTGKVVIAEGITASGTITGDGGDAIIGYRKNFLAGTDAIALTTAMSGKVFTNAGDADGNIYTLPEGSTAIGCYYTFVVAAATAVNVNPNDGTDRFIGPIVDNPGDSIQSSTIGDSVTVLCIDATNWVILAAYPAATDWPDAN
jgi:hypothetical protein